MFSVLDWCWEMEKRSAPKRMKLLCQAAQAFQQ